MSNRLILAFFLFLSPNLFGDLVVPPKVAAANPKLIKPETLASISKVKPVTLSKGGKSQIVVEVEVAKDFHVQANPASQPNFIPTSLTLDAVSGLKFGTPEYPKGQPYKLAGSPTEVMAYGGKFEIKVPIESEAAMKPGKITVNGKLRYQACNEKTCYFPVSIPVSATVAVK